MYNVNVLQKPYLGIRLGSPIYQYSRYTNNNDMSNNLLIILIRSYFNFHQHKKNCEKNNKDSYDFRCRKFINKLLTLSELYY